ncbi:hypothetical protein [Lactococcus kimchii]|uniref:hypothetical protein n=1 Tax=Lactococcus sp. S-13 TaxID=2507158 RepID=UPI0010234D00|nr:hypothetical protein [Lactococcus sp. S-13]RZI48556.1 hypothetical protein EQJ87_03300 [Lactococcus sp. S-13]
MSRYFEYKQAKEELNKISRNPQNYLLIHYSCSDVKKEEFPKVSSISIMKFENREKIQFSISKYLKEGVTLDQAEKELFDNFFQFIENNKSLVFIHWNMNSEKFGFEGLENRYRVLTNQSKNILGYLKKIDLDDLLGNYYSESYISDPKMYKLYDFNSFDIHNFLKGKEEADLYLQERWFEISESSTAKVNFIYDVLKLTMSRKLKVEDRFIAKKTLWSDGIQYFFNEKLLGRFIFWLLVTLIGAILSSFVTNFIFKN